MKRFVIMMILVVMMVALCGCTSTNGKEYAQMTVVVEVNREADEVVCKDFNGMLWVFTGCEDWAEGDIAAMIMNDMGTELIFDDEIVSVKYDGWIEGWF